MHAGDVEKFLRRVLTELAAERRPPEELDRFIGPLRRIDPQALRVTASLPNPALRHLPRALELAAAGPCPSLVQALYPLITNLRWSRCYARSRWSAAFRDRLGVGELVGPTGPVASSEIALGIVVLGPGTLYPPHAHPAAELYFILGGAPRFRSGDEPWRTKDPGALIYHAGDRLHAIRTQGGPMLALFAWAGDIEGAIWRPNSTGRRFEQRI